MFQLTRFLHNMVFFRNQNACYAGTRCTCQLLFIFCKKAKTSKRHFEINWPLVGVVTTPPLFLPKFWNKGILLHKQDKWRTVRKQLATFCSICTVQSWFSDILFSDKSQFSDNFVEDHFLVHRNISFSDNLVFSAPSI